MATQWIIQRKGTVIMDQIYGLFLYAISLLTFGGIYAILSIGLNIQWGFAGLFNAGVAGFFAVGAYTTAIFSAPESAKHLGGFHMFNGFGIVVGMMIAGGLAIAVGKVCLRLKSDYLAIATLGIAMIFQLILKNEVELTNGSRGIFSVPRPFERLPEPVNQLAFLAVIIICLSIVYVLAQQAHKSPWGRAMTALRDNEDSAKAAGKNVEYFRMQGFVIGSMIMALAGGLMTHYLKFAEPTLTDPVHYTFLVWVMLIMGGSGNNRGAILGAFIMWVVWSASELFTGMLPMEWATRGSYIRIFLIGLILQIILQKFPQGILPEKRPTSH